MWQKALDKMLRSTLGRGNICICMPDGRVHRYGDETGQPLTVRLTDTATVRRLVINPELAFGESYMNGTLTVDGDEIQALIGLIVQNLNATQRVWWQRPLLRLRVALRRFAQNNVVHRAKRNVAHHYDLSGQLYDLFLDEDRQYSCAYFRDPSDTLEQAQTNKKHHIASKLLIKPGMRVLDIGCGWGGMAITLARDYGADVVGITLSKEQHAYAVERAAREGLSDRIDFRLCDYREVTETFDRVVSVGMFEHVGLPHFDTYFQTIKDRLSPDGIALVHTIGWTGPPDATNPWIAKYIFPGGYIPTASETLAAIERSRLWTADIEFLRLHYAYTIRHWFDRFLENQSTVKDLYDERFVRMWKFYLAASEQTFRHGRQAVFQFQLSKKIDSVPLTREYLSNAARTDQSDRAAE